MKRLILLIAILSAFAWPAFAQQTWIVGSCAGASFSHPQDAVNAAAPGDVIRVCPGTYGSRVYTTIPPHWSPNDQYAPALIVYKNGLTIEAIDPDPSKTIIETTHNLWSNAVAIQASTGGTWNGSAYVGAGVNPTNGTAPNAITIIANDVTIKGFTLRAPGVVWNTAGVMIGGLFAGDGDHLGVNNNTVTNCVFSDVWHAVYIWHSSDNSIINNEVMPLGSVTGHWAAISIYDGYNVAQIALGSLSQFNRIIGNTLADKGISVGAWAPLIWTDNSGTKVHANKATQIGTAYSQGSKMFSGNMLESGYWESETSGAKFPGNSNHAPPPGYQGYELK